VGGGAPARAIGLVTGPVTLTPLFKSGGEEADARARRLASSLLFSLLFSFFLFFRASDTFSFLDGTASLALGEEEGAGCLSTLFAEGGCPSLLPLR